MQNNRLKTKVVSLVSAGIIAVSGFCSASLLTIGKSCFEQKSYEQILRDYASFGVDPGVADSLSLAAGETKNVRLNISEERPVVVDIDEINEEREIKIIERIVDYYNKIFSTINENYEFVIKDDNTDVRFTDTIISISNDDLNDYEKAYHQMQGVFPNLGDGAFVFKSNIVVNWENIKDEDDLYIYSVILHEFGHSLGLGDVYYDEENKTVDFVDMTTMMCLNNCVTSALYPNDYAILQALYSNEYEKHDSYDETVKIVNEKITKYTEGFYKYYAGFLKEKYNATDKMELNELGEELVWQGEYNSNSDYTYHLKLKENNVCELVIKDKFNNVIEKAKGDTLFVDGVLFVKKINIEKASNYSKLYEDDLSVKLMFCIYKKENGKIVLRDATSLVMNVNNIKMDRLFSK